MIESLSYIGFTSPNAAAWNTFGPEVLGLELTGPGPDGAVRLRNDDAPYRIAVHPGDADDLAYLGWAVTGPVELADAVTHLTKHDIEVHEGDAELAVLREVAEVAWYTDPFGFRHELAHGRHAGLAFLPGRPISGFVTGAAGLGHAVLIVPDLAAAEAFFLDVMDFKLSDSVESGMSIRFLHCNERHHTLAFALVPGMVGMHHLMLEVQSLDDVGTGLDLVNARQIPLAMSLGRHTNDHMTSFYVRTPSGFEVEYGYGGVLVDDTSWETTQYDKESIWGHKPPADGPLFPGIIRPFEAAS